MRSFGRAPPWTRPPLVGFFELVGMVAVLGSDRWSGIRVPELGSTITTARERELAAPVAFELRSVPYFFRFAALNATAARISSLNAASSIASSL